MPEDSYSALPWPAFCVPARFLADMKKGVTMRLHVVVDRILEVVEPCRLITTVLATGTDAGADGYDPRYLSGWFLRRHGRTPVTVVFSGDSRKGA